MLLGLTVLSSPGCGRVKERVKEQAKAWLRPAAEPAVAEAQPAARPKTKSPKPKMPLGVNLTDVVYYSTSIPFVDVMKMAEDFITLNAAPVPGGKNAWNTGFADKIPRDAEGYPLEIPYVVPGAEAPQIVIAPVAMRVYGGRYTLRYDGDGEIVFHPPNAAKLTMLGPGRGVVEMSAADESFFMSIKRSNRKNHVRNVRLYAPGFDGSDPKQVFHPDFLARLRGVSAIRFMGWGRITGSYVDRWKMRATPEMFQGTWRGVAPEYMVDLANELHADAWINIPHKADDEYVEALAKLVRDRLDKDQRVYIEYSNELWNGLFEQQKYAIERGCQVGLNSVGAYPGACEGGSAYWSAIKWNARRSAEIFRIFEKTFGGTSRIVRLLAGQAAFLHSNENLLGSFYDRKINPVGGQVDALAIAPYFASELGSQLGEKPEGATVGVDEIADRMVRLIPAEVGKRTADNKALADRFGARLIAYESGQHLLAMGERAKDTAFVSKLIAASRSPAMRGAYKQMIDTWLRESDRDLIMLFVYVEKPSQYGSWGMLDSQLQPSEKAPKFLGFLDAMQELTSAAN